MLAPEALIICGEHVADWLEFFFIVDAIRKLDGILPAYQSHLQGSGISVYLLGLCHLALSPTFRSQGRIVSLAEAQAQGSTLLDLMCNFMDRKTTVPHDKVYALLGLAQDIHPQVFVVDYTKPIREVFAYVTRHFLQQYADLTVLKLVIIGSPHAMPNQESWSLPSWVPDYEDNNSNQDLGRRPFRRVTRHGVDRLYNATGLSKAVVTAADDLLLYCQGIVIGNITRLSERASNFIRNEGIDKQALTGGKWSFMAKECAVDGIYPPTGEPIELAYARTRIEDVLPTEIGHESGADRRSRAGQLTRVPDPASSTSEIYKDAQTPGQAGDNVVHILQATSFARLFITDTGYMGLADHSCVAGDSVYLLVGGDMPFVLRKLSTGTHQFQGEAYVHGIMDGEFLLKHFKSKKGEAEEMSDEGWLDSLGDGPLPFPTEAVTLS